MKTDYLTDDQVDGYQHDDNDKYDYNDDQDDVS